MDFFAAGRQVPAHYAELRATVSSDIVVVGYIRASW